MLTLGSVCSGVDGLALGFEWAGWQTVWQAESNPWCSSILSQHWPDVPNLSDLRYIESAEPVDLICGGIPCQPFSHAGSRDGTRDDRHLWPAMLRLIRLVKPRLVLVENVYGLVTNRSGVVLEAIYADLEAEDYEAAPAFVLPACASGDTVHRRDRVWICAHARHNWRSPEPGEQQGQRTEVPPALCEVSRTDRGWQAQPGLGRTVDGFPSRLDVTRHKAIGNATVPIAAYDVARLLARSIE